MLATAPFSLAARIRDTRNSLRLSQTDFGALFIPKVSRDLIAEIESDDHKAAYYILFAVGALDRADPHTMPGRRMILEFCAPVEHTRPFAPGDSCRQCGRLLQKHHHTDADCIAWWLDERNPGRMTVQAIALRLHLSIGAVEEVQHRRLVLAEGERA